MRYDAMIIIDVQTALVESHPYNEKKFIENIGLLLHNCRERKIPVIYVRNDGGSGDELEPGSAGWQIYKAIAPLAEEMIFDKRYNSAFRKTGLHEFLKSIGAENLILCGMQTEYCMDASCKVAFEYEYHVTIPQGTTTTLDNDFATGEALSKYYEERIWNNRYARVSSVQELIADMLK